MRRLGQHFLRNKSALKKLAAALELENGNIVIEIGGGHGELTEQIKSEKLKIKNSGIEIIVVEEDGGLAGGLRKRFADERGVEIVEGDALKILRPLIESLNLKIANRKLKIAGNIPYYITGKLLRLIGELKSKPAMCVFTVQKEVAERISARPPHMNKLAASVQFWTDAKIIENLRREDFYPPPDVESAIIKLKTKNLKLETGGSEKYHAAARGLFAQPRQTIANNLKRAAKMPKTELAEKLKHIGINPESRPQNLNIEDIAKISEIL